MSCDMETESNKDSCYVSVIKEISNGVTTSVNMQSDNPHIKRRSNSAEDLRANHGAQNTTHGHMHYNTQYFKQSQVDIIPKTIRPCSYQNSPVYGHSVPNSYVLSSAQDLSVKSAADEHCDEADDNTSMNVDRNDTGEVELYRSSSIESLDAWDKAWKSGGALWHKTGVHELLSRHFDTLSGHRRNLKIFFPLCGKAVDMKWLADMGHTVVGVEGVSYPLEKFMEENDVKYTIKQHQLINGSVYESIEGNIRLYRCDILDFNSSLEGHFDAIWDRGGLTAMFPLDRDKYITLLLNMMAPGCHYLLTTVDYDTSNHNTSPYVIPVKELRRLYGRYCNLRQIDEIQEHNAARDIPVVTEKLYHITFKSPGC